MGWRDFQFTTLRDKRDKRGKRSELENEPAPSIPFTPFIPRGSNQKGTPSIVTDLDYWLTRVKQAESQHEVFTTLDAFRPLPWSDEQMSQVYIRKLGAECCLSGSYAPDMQSNDTPPVWTAEACRKRIDALIQSNRDPLDCWREATRWTCRQSQQGEARAAWARDCFDQLEAAWVELGGDAWAQGQP